MSKTNLALEHLWAKKRSNETGKYWLPLLTHANDTMLIINWLYHHWLSPAQQNFIETSLSPQEAAKLVQFLGFFHDIGKATPAFQKKTAYNHDQKLDDQLIQKLLQNGLSEFSQYQTPELIRRQSPHNLAGQTILTNFGLNPTIATIIGGHHGIPAERHFNPQLELNDHTSNYYQVDYQDGPIAHKWTAIYQAFIQTGLTQIGYQSLNEIPQIQQPQAVILEGLLIMADWLASSESYQQQPLFPLISINQNYPDIDEAARFHHAIQLWHTDDQWTPQSVNNITDLFQSRWHFNPRPVQLQMLQAIRQIKHPGLIIIEDACGAGKTEIALAATEIIAPKTQENGLYIGLPSQATANTMYSRINNWLQSVAEQTHQKLELNLIHGKAKLNHQAQSLPQANNVTSDSAVVINSWFNGKKSILINFNVATIDNFLRMALKERHNFLRHLAFSGKVVVIDEIHAYDTYMSSYLEKALQWLGTYHVPVIALSATLPTQKRHELLNAYRDGRDHIGPQPVTPTKDNQYPLLSYLDGANLHQVSNFPTEPPKTIKITRLDDHPQKLINTIHQSLQNGGVAGVIVNTVHRAQKIAQMLTDLPTLILHASFVAPDRAKLEKQLIKLTGKNAQRPAKLVVIGTQVLSQSLDIDFDILFTDLAPIDLVIQRIGRLHRHQIKRPPTLQNPQVFLIGAQTYGHYDQGTEAIYQKYYLMKTDYFLAKSAITLPQDTADLIQKVYSIDTNDQVPNLQPAQQQAKAYQISEQTKAKTYQIKHPQPKKTLQGWLDGISQTKGDESKANAYVRDIDPTLEVILLKRQANQILTVSSSTNINQLSSEQLSNETIRLPHALTLNFTQVHQALQAATDQQFPQWKNDPWLHHQCCIILNSNNVGQLNNNTWIKYDAKLGLTWWHQSE